MFAVCVYLCIQVKQIYIFLTGEDFSVKLSASQEEIKEGEAFNLTCMVPPGPIYLQNWLHPSKEVKKVFPQNIHTLSYLLVLQHFTLSLLIC